MESDYPGGHTKGMHAHANPDLTIVASGAYQTGRAGRRHDCGPMQVLFLPGGYEHSDRFPDAPTRLFIIELRTPRWEMLGRRCQPPQVSCVIDSPFVRATRTALCRALEGATLLDLTIEDHVGQLLSAVVRYDESPSRFGRPRGLAAAMELLRESFRWRLGLCDLAAAAGLHPVHFARVFRAHLGCSVGCYVQRLRAECAARALAETDRPLAQIALESGFYDQAQFSRIFKRLAGVTPGRYRAFNRIARS